MLTYSVQITHNPESTTLTPPGDFHKHFYLHSWFEKTFLLGVKKKVLCFH